MGSICGILKRNEEKIEPQLSFRMMDKLRTYPLDVSDTWHKDNIFFGNCLQHLTSESLSETIPYFDSTSNLAITCDVILDNREELSSLLDLPAKRLTKLPNSQLILQAYQKWGRECLQYLLGDFAFAIWDGNKKEMFCAVDHTGNRTFYYYVSPRVFSFCTFMLPLFTLQEVSRQYSEEWICDFLSIPSVVHQLDCELTLYRDIHMLPAGHSLTLKQDRIVKKTYWMVERKQVLRLTSDREYEEAFRDVLGQAVRCRVRTIKPVGIFLSGGLDSSTIACFAADELIKRNEYLHAFSAIPLAGFNCTSLSHKQIADETPFIESLRGGYENITFNYCSFPGRHSLQETEKYFSVLEQPYKILENLFWIDGLLNEAENQGIGTILTGGMGNSTISYGNFSQCARSLFQTGRWGELVKEIKDYGNRRNRTIAKVAFQLFKSTLSSTWAGNLYQRGKLFEAKPFDLTPVNPYFARLIDMEKRFQKYDYDPSYQRKLNAFNHRESILAPHHLSHLATIYTKLSLSHNLIIRDPSLDKRVIEFCFSLPVEQFIRHGQDRSLIRQAMSGILPDKIRLNDRVRGVQSADYARRLLPLEKEIYKEIKDIGKLEIERMYLDIKKIQDQAEKIDLSAPNAFTNPYLRMLLRSIIFSRFLRGQ